MHETGIARDVVRRVVRAAADAGAERVGSVAVWLGALSQFSADHFREHFDEAARGTIVQGARLDIEVSNEVLHSNSQNVLLQSIQFELVGQGS